MNPDAATNVWWIIIDEKTFTYNLKRLGTERIFKIGIDLTKPIAQPDVLWAGRNKQRLLNTLFTISSFLFSLDENLCVPISGLILIITFFIFHL